MITEHIIISNITDLGGMYDITKQFKKFVYQDIEYTYIATGLVRDVFRSDCGKWVIKIPKQKYRIDHNILEYEVYRDAPDWCKLHIAETKLTKDNYVIQEYVKVNPCAGNYYRELGIRESDGRTVIFDCDIFLDHSMEKPRLGFKYQQVFCKSPVFNEAYEEARSLPRKLRLQHRAAVDKHFPNIDKQVFRDINGDITIDGVLVPLDIANECGFTIDSRMAYD